MPLHDKSTRKAIIHISPDFSYEKKLRRTGFRVIIGVDEVGVGPLAGPVTACAVSAPVFFTYRNRAGALQALKKLRDSKKLSKKQREEFFNRFSKEGDLCWQVASVSPKVIDKINIYEARRLAAKRAVMKLERALARRADIILLDGRNVLRIPRRQEAIIKGDEKIALCAIASIIAKVTRDRAMLCCHKKYPQYRFDLHKGYGTRLHYAMIAKHGPCAIHRRSFNLYRNSPHPTPAVTPDVFVGIPTPATARHRDLRKEEV